LGVVQKIIASIFDGSGNINEAIYNDSALLSRQYFTPLQYGVILLDNQLSLVKYNEHVYDEFGEQYVKSIASNVAANTTIVLSDTTGLEPNMIISSLSVQNDSDPTIVANPNTKIISINGNVVITSNLVTGNVGDKITFTAVTHKAGTSEPWRDLINVYGNVTNGSSQISLELEDGNEVVGTIAYNPVNDTLLLWSPDIDTIPTNTLEPINAIIDPLSSRPNKDLQDLATGTRYLLVNDYHTANGAHAYYNWLGIDDTPLTANANDIIEFNGQHWSVAFDSQYETSVQYITNLTTSTQYRWDGQSWAKSYEGYYPAGKWQITL
jgi:hypothetical protein